MVGTAALVLGVIGIFLPVLPTTPFLLVTAACYARASTRLYEWLLGQPSLGPIISRVAPLPVAAAGRQDPRAGVVAITFALSIDRWSMRPWRRVVLVITGVILATFLYRIPTAPSGGMSVTMGSTPPQEELR